MMPMFRRLLLYGWMIASLLGTLKAQNADPYNTSLVFSYVTINEGLSSNTVRALLQDQKGFVWMGTSRGLNRYDGYRVVQLNKTRSLAVTALVEMGDTLWVGTDNGLFLYLQRADSVRKFVQKTTDFSLESLNVSSMQADPDGNLWLSTMDSGILRLDTRTGKMKKVPTPDDAQAWGCIYVNKKGEVWAAGNWSRVKLVRYNRQSDAFEEEHLQFDGGKGSEGREPSALSSIAMTEDAEGRMWLGLWEGALVRFNPANRRADVVAKDPALMRHIHSVQEVEKGFLLVGSDLGLTLVDVKTGRMRQHTRSDLTTSALSDNFVYPIMVDREGGTWIGTYYGGVNYTHRVSGNFTSYTHNPHGNSVSGNVVNHFCEDAYHRIWIASDDGGLCVYDPEQDTFTPVSLGGGTHNVHALCMDGDQLYVGTYTQGLDIVDVNTLQSVNIPVFQDDKGEYFDASSYAMCSDRQKRIWVGTFDEVAIFHPDTRTFSDVKKVEVPVTDIVQDHTDCVWVATDGNGVWAYGKNGKWKHYRDFGLGEQAAGTLVSVYSLFEDGSGMLWAGTSYGLFFYDRKADTFCKAKLVADALSIFGISAVEGKLWLSTSMGILCYSLTEHEVVQVYKGGGNIVCTDFLPDAIMRGDDGRVYLGTTNGFVFFKPQSMFRNESQPQVVFTGLDIFNRPVAVGTDILPKSLPYLDELRLSYREAMFRISFSALSYLQPSDILYSYYLEGFDDDWIDAGNQQSVTYTNLSPGTYILHVRAVTNDGVQSDDATLRIVITPPFYWNTPAKILYLLLIVLGVFFYVRYLLKKNEKRHVAEIQEINTQKEQEIQEINTQKEQEIQEINIQKEQEVHDARIKFMTINDKDQAFLDKMETVIEQNFSNSDLSVDYLASELGVSRSGLFAKIKALADVTPNEMIQVIRLKHAASLMLSGSYRVNEVCYMVGFSSPSYFAKCFQKQYGCTPAKYKG